MAKKRQKAKNLLLEVHRKIKTGNIVRVLSLELEISGKERRKGKKIMKCRRKLCKGSVNSKKDKVRERKECKK